MSDRYDSNFIEQLNRQARRKRQQDEAALPAMLAADETVVDATKTIRAKQANLCDAVMMRVVELETAAAQMTEVAKKLRAAVMANT